MKEYTELKNPHKFVVECSVPGVRRLLYHELSYFEAEEFCTKKTRIVFHKDVTIWVNARYSAIISALEYLYVRYPNIIHCNKAALEWLLDK